MDFQKHCSLIPVEINAVLFELLKASLNTLKFRDTTVAVLACMASTKK